MKPLCLLRGAPFSGKEPAFFFSDAITLYSCRVGVYYSALDCLFVVVFCFRGSYRIIASFGKKWGATNIDSFDDVVVRNCGYFGHFFIAVGSTE
jgi:hypothetical protein